MGLFSMFKKKTQVQEEQPTTKVVYGSGDQTQKATTEDTYAPKVTTSGINLEKRQAINLRKEKVNAICLTKKPLSTLKARVVLAFDYSGSMSSLYSKGKVQEALERIFPIALRFDDDGDMGMWMFDDSYRRIADVNMDNVDGYVKNEMMKYNMGGTNYSGVIRDICTQYIKKEPSDIPTYVIFVTDGDCWDKEDSEEAIKVASKHNIFWQFVGIGKQSFEFLEELDDMPGRYLDNADFFNINDLHSMSDEDLYNKLLTEFPNWVSQARAKGMIK